MTLKNYLIISGIMFLIIALIHLVRAAAGWIIVVGSVNMPTIFSVGVVLVMGFLAFTAFKLAKTA
jgi:hypothetical protein